MASLKVVLRVCYLPYCMQFVLENRMELYFEAVIELVFISQHYTSNIFLSQYFIICSFTRSSFCFAKTS